MTIVSFPLESSNPAPLLAFFDACKTSDDTFNCKLGNTLSLLHVVAATLAVILLVVVIFAVRAWQSSKNSGEFPSKPKSRQP